MVYSPRTPQEANLLSVLASLKEVLDNLLDSESNDTEVVIGNAPSGSADTGNPVKVGGRYNATPPTLTDGQRGDMQLDSRGNTRISLAVRLDEVNDAILAVPKGHSWQLITAAGTNVIKNGAGTIRQIRVLGGTMGAVTVYNNTAASGTSKPVDGFTPAGATIFAEDLDMSAGITVVTAAATIILVSYR